MIHAHSPAPPMARHDERVVSTGGRQVVYDKSNHLRGIDAPGMRARFDGTGRPEHFRVEQNGVAHSMYRAPGGVRIVERVSGGGRERVVVYGSGRALLERPMANRPGYTLRSIRERGHLSAVVLSNHHFGAIQYSRPVPAYVYAPGFYGWAVNPWVTPISITVGFTSQPWYSMYGQPPFQPYASYASADQWMTDQLLASYAKQSYDLTGNATTLDPSAAPPPISPELKAQINAQLKLEVEEMGAVAADGAGKLVPDNPNSGDELPPALMEGHTIFRVVTQLEVEVNGVTCTLNRDDFITRKGGLQEDGMVPVEVTSSRPANECAMGSQTAVSINNLDSMQEEHSEQVLAVLKMASDSLGKNGMPPGPAGGSGAQPFPGGQAAPDPELTRLAQQAQKDSAESESAVIAASKGAQGQ